MDKFKALRAVKKSNRFISILLFLQIFLMLTIVLPLYNGYKMDIKDYTLLKNSPVKNSIYYMGRPVYFVEKDGETISNERDYEYDKKKVYEYVYNHPETFKDITPTTMKYTYVNNKNLSELYLYDKTSFEIFKPYMLGDYDFSKYDDIDEIAVLASESDKNRFPLDSYFDFKTDNLDVRLKVIGYYNKDTKFMKLNATASSNFLVNRLINKYDTNYSSFITLENRKLDKYSVFNKIDKFYHTMIYLRDDAKKEDIADFEKYIDDNSLGYYLYGSGLIDKQEDTNRQFIQSHLDLYISFFVVIIFSFIAIGYINVDRWRDRYEVYYLNGASKSDLYMISFMYYTYTIILPLFIYRIFCDLIRVKFINEFLGKNLRRIAKLSSYNNYLELRELIILLVVFFIIIGVISYWPIKKNRERTGGGKI